MSAKILVRAAAAAIVAVPAAGAQPTIADLAPEQSFLIVSVPDWAEVEGAFWRTPLGDLWREREIQDFVERLMEEPMAQLRDGLAEIETDMEELKTPVGAVGLAAYFVEGEAAPRAIVMADYGDRAEGMRAVLDRMLDKGVEDDAILVDEEEHEGATIYTLTILRDEEEEEAPADEGDEGDEGPGWGEADEAEEEWEDWEFEESDPVDDFFGQTDEVTIAVREGVFLVSPDAEAVDRALEALGGGEIDCAARAEGYAAALGQHAPDLDALVVLRLAPVMPMLVEQVSQGISAFMPEEFDAGPMLEAAGLGGLEALSFGMKLDTAEATLEQTIGVLAPEPKGLLALMSARTAPLNPPAFVGGDAAEYAQYTFDFAGLVEAARGVIAALPEAARAEAEPRFEQGFVPIFSPLLAAIGPEVYFSRTYTRPLGLSSERSFVAIPTRDEAAVNNLLAVVPMFRATQVEGSVIYSVEMGEMGVPAALGVGAGHVIIGTRDDVQDALRQAANPEGPRLADEGRYKRAVAPLRDPGLWYGYQEFAPGYEWMLWQFENMDQVQREQFAQMGMEPADIDEMMEMMGDSTPEWATQLPSATLLREYVGDLSFELHQAPDGMRGRWLLLRPQE